MDQIDTEEVPALSVQRRADPLSIDLQQAVLDAQFIVGSLSLIRTEAIRILVDELGMSYADVAKLTGERVKLMRNGSVATDPETGAVIMVPSLSRQRIHQIHKGGRPYMDSFGGGKLAAKAS